MSHWEEIEFELSRLYTWFGDSLDDQLLMNEYGKGTIFRMRAAALATKAEEFFVSNPNQNREGEFHNLLANATGFANRRNDIAHGIVFQIDKITFFRDRLKPNLLKRDHFAVIPPLYAFRYANAEGFPKFAYTSKEMRTLERRLQKLHKAIEKFRLDG